MSGRLMMIGQASTRGDSAVAKAALRPTRTPFLHPKARPFSPTVAAARQAGNVGVVAARASGSYSALVGSARAAASGPKAPPKVLRSLSGQDYGETISRLGRATRRQNKEFSAIVHPYSGRVMDMRRGNGLTTSYGTGALINRSTERMAHLADKARNPEVRRRATANLKGDNPNLRGADPVLVHNHPNLNHHQGVKGRGGVRAYPSSLDLNAAVQIPNNSRHVVLSHAPKGPAGRKTKAVTTRVVERGEKNIGALGRIGEKDLASLPKSRKMNRTIASMGTDPRAVASGRRFAQRQKPPRGTYDQVVRGELGSRDSIQRTGIYSTATFHKVDTTMSERQAARIARQYGTKGPLPKGLDRDTKMKAYEGRYIASGGKKVEMWGRRANRAETGRNMGLAGATVAAGGLLAARGRRTGPAMARNKVLRRATPHRLETAALGSALGGGWSELYGEHARSRRASYQNTPAGVAGSALTRMRAYTPDRRTT